MPYRTALEVKHLDRPGRHSVGENLHLLIKKSGKRTWAPYVSIVNAYNARNVFTYFFDYSDNPPTRTAISQFPFIPTAGVSVSW